jgi:hypothetical protein
VDTLKLRSDGAPKGSVSGSVLRATQGTSGQQVAANCGRITPSATCVRKLITRRSRVRIPPPLPQKGPQMRPFLLSGPWSLADAGAQLGPKILWESVAWTPPALSPLAASFRKRSASGASSQVCLTSFGLRWRRKLGGGDSARLRRRWRPGRQGSRIPSARPRARLASRTTTR